MPKPSAEHEAGQDVLSRRNREFLNFVAEHPECLERSTFETVDAVGSRIGYPVQAWPTFIRRDELRRLARLNVELCRLVKSVPRKVFGADAEELRRFYGLNPEHARLAAAALGNPEWVDGALARSDFYHTGSGFKCLEFNIAGNLGGWQSTDWSDAVLQVPAVDRFVTGAGIEPGRIDVLQRLLSFLLAQALRKFRSSEVNIGFLTPKPMEHLIASARGLYRRILAQLGSVGGTLIQCSDDDLVERQGLLFAGETRVHVLLDGLSGPAGADAYRCWVRGTVSLYNGLLAPVLTDKRNLALLSELADSDLWSREEKELIRGAVPWTRRVSTVSVHPQAREVLTPDLLLSERERLVLKPAAGEGGRDVYLGASTGESDWADAVTHAFDEGTWLVQERQESLPHLYQHGATGCVPHGVVWSFFVFGETFGGVFLRMAPQDRGPINAACGAESAWVFEVDE